MFQVIAGNFQRDWMKECEFTLARSANDLFDFAAKATVDFGHDWETNTLNVEKARIVGYSCSYDEKHGLYYPVSHTVGADLNLPIGPVNEVMKSFEAKPKPFANVWWNWTGYDQPVMHRNLGWSLSNWDDAMIAVFLKNSNYNEYGLKATAMRELGIEMIEFEEVTQGRTFDQIHPDEATPYAASDSCVNLRVWHLPSVRQAISTDPMWGQQFIYNLERQVGPVLQEGMNYKVWLDINKLEQLRISTIKKIADLEAEIYSLCGGPFNIGSSVALGKKLEELGVHIKQRTKTGQAETKKEILIRYKNDHPSITKIIAWKELTTQNRNYIDKLIAAVNYFGPLVRFAFHHIGVPTGRMKCGGSGKGELAYNKGVADVNVQSLPDHKKQKYLPNIRSAIVANDPRLVDSREWAIIAIDYSQVELRIAGNLSREPTFIAEFSKPKSDIHKRSAELAYRRKLDTSIDADKALRDRGKTINFAILYGGSGWTVAEHAEISVEQGTLLADNFFAGAPKLKEWIDGWIKMARKAKIVKTYFGRIRHLDEFYNDKVPKRVFFKGDREAVNDPIQGGAADIFKIACVKVAKLIKDKNWQNDCQHTLYMHDELVFRIRVSMLEQIVPALQQIMEFDVKGWPIKLTTEVEAGWNWGEMVSYEKFIEVLRAGVVPEIVAADESEEEFKISEEESEFEEEMEEARRDHGNVRSTW